MPPALFIMGPTAAGKTDLAIRLAAEEYPVEIISVDSALVYRGMDIGTAKPPSALLAQYPHHLIDIRDPCDHYSVGDFRRDALTIMADITARGKVPLLVGGTMLYFKALQQGLADLPAADPDIRQRLDNEMMEKGLLGLHKRLAAVDPVSAKRIHPNDPQRLQRALEVYDITGQSLTSLTQQTKTALPYLVIKIILSPFDRAILHQRIAKRYHAMMADGFLQEVTRFYQRSDCHAELPAMRSVGYRQLWQHLRGDFDLETSVDKAIIATRQMAKRQLTWLRAQQDGVWFNTNDGLPLTEILTFISHTLPELKIKT